MKLLLQSAIVGALKFDFDGPVIEHSQKQRELVEKHVASAEDLTTYEMCYNLNRFYELDLLWRAENSWVRWLGHLGNELQTFAMTIYQLEEVDRLKYYLEKYPHRVPASLPALYKVIAANEDDFLTKYRKDDDICKEFKPMRLEKALPKLARACSEDESKATQ